MSVHTKKMPIGLSNSRPKNKNKRHHWKRYRGQGKAHHG